MVRGTTSFRCPKCGHVFTAMDVEWNATVLYAPMPCPQCGTESPAIKDEWFGLGKWIKKLLGLKG